MKTLTIRTYTLKRACLKAYFTNPIKALIARSGRYSIFRKKGGRADAYHTDLSIDDYIMGFNTNGTYNAYLWQKIPYILRKPQYHIKIEIEEEQAQKILDFFTELKQANNINYYWLGAFASWLDSATYSTRLLFNNITRGKKNHTFCSDFTNDCLRLIGIDTGLRKGEASPNELLDALIALGYEAKKISR